MNNQEPKIRTKIININSNEPSFYSDSILVNKCSGSCNSINDPYAKLCVPDVVENINVKVFNPMSTTNEHRHIKWHQTCKYKCRLDAFVTISKGGMKINLGVNVKNYLAKEYVIKNLFGIVVIVIANVINYVMLENI